MGTLEQYKLPLVNVRILAYTFHEFEYCRQKKTKLLIFKAMFLTVLELRIEIT